MGSSNPLKAVVDTVDKVVGSNMGGHNSGGALNQGIKGVSGELGRIGDKIDGAIGTNMGGDNPGGYLNQVIKTVEAYNPTKMLSDLATGKNPLNDMKSSMTDLARKTGLGFDFRQKQPTQSGGSNSASTAVSNLASAKTNEASATNKANALNIGYNIGDKANAKAKQLGSLNAGRISEDEQANQNSLLLKKLKKAGNSSSFSNDFIR